MKKIVGIIAAVAMAASVFAVDFSAGTKIGGSLFNYDENGKIHMFKEANGSSKDANPNFSFSIGDDKAGAAIKITSNGGQAASGGYATVGAAAQSIWFKPFDMLKVTVGTTGTNLNQEHVSWWRGSQSGTAGEAGYALAFTPIDGLEIDAFILMGEGNWWFDDGSVNELAVKFQYSADFGTIAALFDANSKFKDLKFGAGYANNFNGVNAWANVLGFYAGEKFQRVRLELDANGSADAFSYEVFVPVDIAIEKGTDYWTNITSTKVAPDPVAVGLVAKVGYNLGGANVSLELRDSNLLAKDFSMVIEPKISGNHGCMAWDLAVTLNCAKTFTVDVPVNFAFNF